MCHQFFICTSSVAQLPWASLTKIAFLKTITSNSELVFARLGFVFSANGTVSKGSHSFLYQPYPDLHFFFTKVFSFDYYSYSCHLPFLGNFDPCRLHVLSFCSYWEHISAFCDSNTSHIPHTHPSLALSDHYCYSQSIRGQLYSLLSSG